MRIISGKHRSRIIKMVGIETTRETSDKVRGAIFNLINGFPMEGVGLDLFSGSGAMGLEALSRGLDFCYFNDLNKKAYSVTTENIKALNLLSQTKIYNNDYQKTLSLIKEQLSFVFLDPPYKLNVCHDIMDYLNKNDLLKSDALVICEVGSETEIVEVDGLSLYKEKNYGIKKVLIYRK